MGEAEFSFSIVLGEGEVNENDAEKGKETAEARFYLGKRIEVGIYRLKSIVKIDKGKQTILYII